MSEKLGIIIASLLLILLWIFCIWHHKDDFDGVSAPPANSNPAANTNANIALPAPSLKVVFENGKYRITGTVSDEAAKQKILARAGEIFGEGNFIDELKVGSVSKASWLDAALALFPFTKDGVTGGGLSAEGNSISLTGQVASQAEKDKIYKDALAAAPPNTTINNLLTIAGQKALSGDQAKTQAKLNEQLAGKIVEFETGSDKLTDKGKAVLDEIFPVFEASAEKVEVGGHTDNQGKPASNLSLSQRRAETVKAYLAGKGLDAARFTPKGYGQERPISDNNTPEGRQRNRRIEFHVIGGEK